ncbi:TlpA family protein disulfide reductase [Sphingobacterium alkalisoli]|nr:TlpA disulfide reductase family protein [Sphingobacterium alkalisoli]
MMIVKKKKYILMKKQMILLLLLMAQATLYAQPRYDSSVFKQRQPKGGEALQIVYDARNKDLEFSDEVQAALFIYDNFRWKRESLKMVKNEEGLWTVQVAVMPSTALIGVKFFQGDINQPDVFDNNNNKGYAVALADMQGNPIPGAYLGEAAFQAPEIAAGGTFGYYTVDPAPLDAGYLKALAVKEQALSGEQYLKYFETLLRLQQLALGSDFNAYASQFINKSLADKNLSEEALGELYQYTKFRLKDNVLTQRIESRIMTQFPKGASARFVAYNNTIESSSDIHQATTSYEDFLKRFPLKEWQENPNNQGFLYYAVYRGIGSGYFDTKQFDKFIALYDDIDFRTGNELMRWNIMRAYMFKTIGQDTLYQISEAILPKLMARKNDGSYLNDFNNKAKADSNMLNQLDDRLFTHISLLNDLKKYKAARTYFFELSEAGKYSNAELNEINLQVLEGLQDDKQILPLLEMSARENAMTPKMFDKLKSIYLKQHNGNEEGYEAYVSNLRSDEEKAEMRAYVDQHWVNYTMPTFRLENADGLFVTPADWNGKIVVVDFWATWCRPCIMAFPGMQLLVDKYKDDKAVAVYMVGTMQTGDYKSKSVNFVRGEGYQFNLLHDSVNPRTNEQDFVFKQLVPLFGDSSIPRKIIVKDGKVRYCSGGYSGSPSKLMDELSLAIEILKNEK